MTAAATPGREQKTSPSPAEASRAQPMVQPGPTWARLAKRGVDLGVAGFLLVVLSPVLAVIAGLVKRSSPGPALFVQERIGQNERPFPLFKFRTMQVSNSDAEHRAFVTAQLEGATDPSTSDGNYKLDDPRVTAIGSMLRRYSLDELPQLFNVVNGTMSLVGPRPSLAWEIELFSPEHRARAAAVPGCSGLWQVSGRNRLTMVEMLDLDVDYVENWSFWRDLGILGRTPSAILRGDGAR